VEDPIEIYNGEAGPPFAPLAARYIVTASQRDR
jgi:hypothetical protein